MGGISRALELQSTSPDPPLRRTSHPPLHPMRALQRSAGNRAVTAMLAAEPVTVSRCGGESHPGCACLGTDEEPMASSAGAAAVQRSESSTEANESNPSELGAEGGAISEATCTALPDVVVVNLVRAYFRVMYPRAYRHLEHYLDGSGAPFVEDVGSLFASNPLAAARVAGMIRDRCGTGSGQLVGRTTSSAVIRQQDYDDQDWKLSIGGVDQIDYEVLERDGSGLTEVTVTLTDPYEWHPAEDRGSQCLHETMEAQKKKGAKDYVSEGTAQVRLSL